MFALPDKPAGSTIRLPFDSYDSNGASVTITGLAVTDIEIYKNAGTTQRASDNGYTLADTDGIDFDGTVGLHGFSIDLSDNSDAGFYAAGSEYWVNVNAVTIDSQTVRFTYYFRIVVAESTSGTPVVDVGRFGNTAVTGRDIGASVLLSSGTGTGQVKLASGYIAPNWGDVGNPTTTVGLTNTTVGVVTLTNTLTTYTGDTPQTGDSFARIGAAGASLTDLGGFSTTAKGQIQTEAEDALVVHRLDELLNADSDIDGAAPPTVGSVFHELLTKTTGSFTYDQTTDSLEAIRDRGDAAWITATGFSTLDAAGVRTAVGLASANLDTQLAAIAAYIDTEIAAILAAVDTEVAAIKAKTDSLTFTVAGKLDANVLYVNGIQVDGVGSDANPWGPV